MLVLWFGCRGVNRCLHDEPTISVVEAVMMGLETDVLTNVFLEGKVLHDSTITKPLDINSAKSSYVALPLRMNSVCGSLNDRRRIVVRCSSFLTFRC